MIYINSQLESMVKDQLYLFISNNLTFRFANADAILSFLCFSITTAIVDVVRQVRLKIFISKINHFPILFLSLRNSWSMFVIQMISLKIDLLPVKLLIQMNQLLIDLNKPFTYLQYVTELQKLDTDVFIANQRKNTRVSPRSTSWTESNFGTIGQSCCSSSEFLALNWSNPFSHYPTTSNTTVSTTTFVSLFLRQFSLI